MAKSKIKSSDKFIKSYSLTHKANPNKVDLLFQFYSVYKAEYKQLTYSYWNKFIHNEILNNQFSHLGSTKHIPTRLNASYLQSCLSQVCANLNKHLDSIEKKFTHFLIKSTIKDKDLLHQLRSINSQHSWLNKISYYYPVIEGKKQQTVISCEVKLLAKSIFKHIIKKQRVKFPNLEKPRLLIDSRLYSLETTKKLNKQGLSTFDYWLRITGLDKGKRIAIPILTNQYFDNAIGKLGGTIELNFSQYDYNITQHHHKSLNKPIKSKKSSKNKGLAKVNRTIKFTFNKQHNLEQISQKLLNKNQPNQIDTNKLTQPDNNLSQLTKVVAFDLGLCNFIATSEGKLLGTQWLNKLKTYDKQIQALASARQSIGLKTRSRRYDNLIAQVKGFIKSEINRILNTYFRQNKGIKTVVIESLTFNKPELSARLNRIIKNFGQGIFKSKLNDLSLIYGFNIEEVNPAYSSQQCYSCSYTDKNNRTTQSQFKCLCCGKQTNADIQAARTIQRRSLNFIRNDKQSFSPNLYKCVILRNIKQDFIYKIESLISHGIVGRRYLYTLLSKNNYFKQGIKSIVKTTQESGLTPMTAYNFDNYLKNNYF